MPRRTPFALAVLAAVTLTGCITGERPTLTAQAQSGTEDPPTEVVLTRLERAPSLEFTATYVIIPSNSNREVTASVVQADGRRRITIGDVTYLVEGGIQRTCVGDVCDEFLDDARVSDLNITHRFWGEAFASRLRLDSSRRTGFSEGFTTTIVGQPAACVLVKVPTVVTDLDSVEYCALDAGVLARYIGADVSIELTSFSFTVDRGGLEL